jgi:hypothetical protein
VPCFLLGTNSSKNKNNSTITFMKQIEIGYLAAIVDGEGYLGITDRGRQLRMVVTSTHRQLPNRLVKMTGKGKATLCKRKKDGRRMPAWQWQCFRRDAVVSILQKIAPHMIIKQEQAKCLLAYAARFANYFNSHKPMTQQESAAAFDFSKKVQSLNSVQKNKAHFSNQQKFDIWKML